MCMFQDKKVKQTKRVVSGFKVVKACIYNYYSNYVSDIEAPHQGILYFDGWQRADSVGIWNRYNNPGYNIYRTRAGATAYLKSNFGFGSSYFVVPVKASHIATTGKDGKHNGFCAMRMYINKPAVIKNINRTIKRRG